MAKPNPVAELAESIAQTLRDHRADADYPFPLSRLSEHLEPTPDADVFGKALRKKPTAEQWVVAQKKNVDSLIALTDDVDRLASSPRLLADLLEQECSAEKPTVPLSKLLTKVEKPLRAALEASLKQRAETNDLPQGVSVVQIKNKPHFHLEKYPLPLSAEEELAKKILEQLADLREKGDEHYPPSVEGLREHLGSAKPAQIKKALQTALFEKDGFVAVPKKADSPVLLERDRAEFLVGGDLIRYLLHQSTTAKKPLASLEKLAGLLHEHLREQFQQAFERLLANATAPQGIDVVPSEDGPLLYLETLASPRWVLAQKVLRQLRSHDVQEAPFCTVRQAFELTAPGTSADEMRAVLKEKDFKSHVILAWANNLDSPIDLVENADALASAPALLEMLLFSVRTEDNQAVPLAQLKKKLNKPLQATFERVVTEQTARHSLPMSVGCVTIKKKPHLFLMQDAVSAPTPPRLPEVTADPALEEDAEFATVFADTFDRLDRAKDSSNLVSLVELRQQIGFEREAFDAGLQELRQQGRYTLSAAEGRHGLTAEQREAGIVEVGMLLLFVSRREKEED